MEIELYGGSGSAINTFATDKTAFPHRDKVFTMQPAALSPNDQPPYPDEGFSFWTVSGFSPFDLGQDSMSFRPLQRPGRHRHRERTCQLAVWGIRELC